MKNFRETEAEKRVQKSEWQYESIIRTAMDGFCLSDRHGNILEVNDAYCKMSGYARQELIKMHISDMAAFESKEEVAEKIKAVYTKGGDRFVRMHRRKDGSIFEVEVSLWCQQGPEGFQASFLRDITEQKKGEEALIAKTERFNHSLDLFFIAGTDGYFRRLNPIWEKTIGYSAKELEGKRFLDLIHPEDIEATMEAIRTLKNQNEVFNFVNRYCAKDGHYHWIEWHAFLEGETIYATGHDISKRKQVEDALNQSEEKHRTILQTAIDGFMLIDKYGNIVEVNDAYCRMSGYTRGELLALNAAVLETTDPSEETEELISEIVEKKTYRFIRKHKRKDGTIFDVEISSQYRAKDGGFVCFIRDITESKQMESRLQQAQKMESIGTLAGGIAHDINNILTPIMMHAELAMEDLSPDDPLQYSMREIFAAGERARDLVKQIVTFSRQKIEKRIPLHFSRIVTESLNFLRSTLPATIDIRYDNRSYTDTVLAVPTQMKQIVINLCANAAHAMREKGGILEIVLDNVTISANNAGTGANLKPRDYLKIIVKDSGAGIPDNIIGRIFEPYYTTKKFGEGTGLGLAITHGIVRNHDGDITVESKVDQGSTFSVYLPLSSVEVPDDVEDKSELPRGSERILLVDDEYAVVKIARRMFEKYGYTVCSATSGTEALAIFRKNPDSFDLVITDMTMPDVTGETLAKEILAIKPGMPVMLCTGYSDNMDKKKAKEIGIKAFIMKPVAKNEFIKKVRGVLDQGKNSERDGS